MDTLASRLAAARNSRELSQPALARLAGVSQGTIGNIEAGLRGGSASLAAIAHALQVSYWWLRDGAGDMELPKRSWPFSAELWEAVRDLDPGALRLAENQLRAHLDLPPLPRPTEGSNGKLPPLAA